MFLLCSLLISFIIVAPFLYTRPLSGMDCELFTTMTPFNIPPYWERYVRFEANSLSKAHHFCVPPSTLVPALKQSLWFQKKPAAH